MARLAIISGLHAQNRIGSIITPQEIGVTGVWKISQVRSFSLLFFVLESVLKLTKCHTVLNVLPIFSFKTQENRQRSHSQQHNKQLQTVQLVKNANLEV